MTHTPTLLLTSWAFYISVKYTNEHLHQEPLFAPVPLCALLGYGVLHTQVPQLACQRLTKRVCTLKWYSPGFGWWEREIRQPLAHHKPARLDIRVGDKINVWTDRAHSCSFIPAAAQSNRYSVHNSTCHNVEAWFNLAKLYQGGKHENKHLKTKQFLSKAGWKSWANLDYAGIHCTDAHDLKYSDDCWKSFFFLNK